MNYLEKLKLKISPSEILPKLSKVKKTEEKSNPPTVKTVLSTFGSKDSKQGSFILEKQKFDSLWQKAWKLADWIDDPGSTIPWQERAAKVPELQKMSMMIGELEMLIEK
jgi:hypothetical protein